MSEIQTTPSSTPPPPAPVAAMKPSGLFGTKIPSSVAFAIGILLFFMPFVDIRCNNMSLQTVSGVQLATGFKVKAAGSDNSFFGKLDNMNTGNTESVGTSKQEDPNTFALVALAAGVISFLLALGNGKVTAAGAIITGGLAAAALIGLLIDVQKQLKAELMPDKDAVISVDFTSGFYIAVIAFLAGAYLSYRRTRAN